jgi:hypothetical protein
MLFFFLRLSSPCPFLLFLNVLLGFHSSSNSIIFISLPPWFYLLCFPPPVFSLYLASFLLFWIFPMAFILLPFRFFSLLFLLFYSLLKYSRLSFFFHFECSLTPFYPLSLPPVFSLYLPSCSPILSLIFGFHSDSFLFSSLHPPAFSLHFFSLLHLSLSFFHPSARHS